MRRTQFSTVRASVEFLVLFSTCLAASPLHAQWNRQSEEDAVYSAVFAHLAISSAQLAVWNSSSYDQKVPVRDKAGRPVVQPDTLLAQLAADYARINTQPRSLRSLARDPDVVIVSDSAMNVLGSPGDDVHTYWRKFKEMYPDRSLVHVSRPGFSGDHRTAMIHVHSGCGARCGTWGVMILIKEGDTWRYDRFLWQVIG